MSPFIDRRREAGAKDEASLYVGMSTPTHPVICYNSLTTTVKELQQMADDECVKHNTGSKAVAQSQTKFSCRLLTPNRLFFKCIK